MMVGATIAYVALLLLGTLEREEKPRGLWMFR